jgi:hypothetical protein
MNGENDSVISASFYPLKDEYEFIREYAKKKHLTLSQAVREAVRTLRELERNGNVANIRENQQR